MLQFNYTYLTEVSQERLKLEKKQVIAFLFLLGQKSTDVINAKYDKLV